MISGSVMQCQTWRQRIAYWSQAIQAIAHAVHGFTQGCWVEQSNLGEHAGTLCE